MFYSIYFLGLLNPHPALCVWVSALSCYIVPAHYLHLCLPVMLPWELPPQKPIGQPVEVAAGEGVQVRGCTAKKRRLQSEEGPTETERQTLRCRKQ